MIGQESCDQQYIIIIMHLQFSILADFRSYMTHEWFSSTLSEDTIMLSTPAEVVIEFVHRYYTVIILLQLTDISDVFLCSSARVSRVRCVQTGFRKFQ